MAKDKERLYFDYGFHGFKMGFGTIVWLIRPNRKKWKFMNFIPHSQSGDK